MRILDKYVFNIFITAFLVFLMAFLSLFVVIDFVTRVNDFIALKGENIPLFIGRFYAYRLPLLLLFVLPAVTLFSSMFTLMRLNRTNEVVPMMVCGVSMRRIAIPFVIAAVLSGGAIAVLEEFVIPPLSDRMTEMEGVLGSDNKSTNISANDGRNYFYAATYLHIKRIMEDIVLTVIENGNRKQLVFAKAGRWDSKLNDWVLSNGRIYEYGPKGRIFVERNIGRPRAAVTVFGENGYVVGSTLKPSEVRKTNSIGAEYTTFARTLELAEKTPWAPQFWIRLHQKLSFPLSGIVLLLLGLPFVVGDEQANLFKGLALCFIVAVAYYAIHFLFLGFGTKGMMGPLVAAWMPTIAFGSLGVYMFWNMRT